MPTTPPTALQMCVDSNLAAGEASPEVLRTVHAGKPATQTRSQTDWWGDAWALWTRHPQGKPQADGALADNLSLNAH
jgi:hypothetical protein